MQCLFRLCVLLIKTFHFVALLIQLFLVLSRGKKFVKFLIIALRCALTHIDFVDRLLCRRFLLRQLRRFHPITLNGTIEVVNQLRIVGVIRKGIVFLALRRLEGRAHDGVHRLPMLPALCVQCRSCAAQQILIPHIFRTVEQFSEYITLLGRVCGKKLSELALRQHNDLAELVGVQA